MWSLGSLRDSLRENAKVARETAKAAAQVAHGVLQAAAAEDDAPPTDISHTASLEQTQSNTDRDSHIQAQSSATSTLDSDPNLTDSVQSSPFPDFPGGPPPPPQNHIQPPLPPPPSENVPAAFMPPVGLPPRSLKGRRSRGSRYVVTGVKTTLQKEDTPAQVKHAPPTTPAMPSPSGSEEILPPPPQSDNTHAPPPRHLKPPSPTPVPPLPSTEQNMPVDWNHNDEDWKVQDIAKNATQESSQPPVSMFVPQIQSVLPTSVAVGVPTVNEANASDSFGDLAIPPTPPSFSASTHDTKGSASKPEDTVFTARGSSEQCANAALEGTEESMVKSNIELSFGGVPVVGESKYESNITGAFDVSPDGFIKPPPSAESRAFPEPVMDSTIEPAAEPATKVTDKPVADAGMTGPRANQVSEPFGEIFSHSATEPSMATDAHDPAQVSRPVTLDPPIDGTAPNVSTKGEDSDDVNGTWNLFSANQADQNGVDDGVNWFGGNIIPVQSPKDHGFYAVFSGAAPAEADTSEKGTTTVEKNVWPITEDVSDSPPVDNNVWPSPKVEADIPPVENWPAPEDELKSVPHGDDFFDSFKEPNSVDPHGKQEATSNSDSGALPGDTSESSKDAIAAALQPSDETTRSDSASAQQMDSSCQTDFLDDSSNRGMQKGEQAPVLAAFHLGSSFHPTAISHGGKDPDEKPQIDASMHFFNGLADNDPIDDTRVTVTENETTCNYSSFDVQQPQPRTDSEHASDEKPKPDGFLEQQDNEIHKNSLDDSWTLMDGNELPTTSPALKVQSSVKSSFLPPDGPAEFASDSVENEPQHQRQHDNAVDSSGPKTHDHMFLNQNAHISTEAPTAAPAAEYANLMEQVKQLTRERDSALTELNANVQCAENRAMDYENLKNQVEYLSEERISAIAETQNKDSETDILRQTIHQLKDDLLQRESALQSFSQDSDVLKKERDIAIEEKGIAERERDLAAERGGDGLREARGAIEELRSSRATIELREAAIMQQVDELRSELSQISAERSQLIGEADGLKHSLNDLQSESRAKEDELSRSLKIAETEFEIAKVEKENAIESSELLKEEVKRLHESEQARVAALVGSESRVKELEMQLLSGDTDREEESMRIDSFTQQVEDMKERTRSIIEERNGLYDEKLRMEGEKEEMRSREHGLSRKLLDMQREVGSLTDEREEWKQQCDSLREQVKEVNKRYEMIGNERDRLVQERAAQASVTSSSHKETALAQECDQKTRAMALMQRKLTSAAAKIEKLTTQRGNFQRQRDDAGARLRAAGAEFISLSSKLANAVQARDEAQSQMVSVRNERDEALTEAQELLKLKPQLEICKESLEAKERDICESCRLVQNAQTEVGTLMEQKSAVEQRCTSLLEGISASNGRVDVVSREKEMLISRLDALEGEKRALSDEIQQLKVDRTTIEANIRKAESELSVEKEKASRDLASIQSRVLNEQQSKVVLEKKVSSAAEEVDEARSTIDAIRRAIVSCLESGNTHLGYSLVDEDSTFSWSGVGQFSVGDHGSKESLQSVEKFCEAMQGLFMAYGKCEFGRKEMEGNCAMLTAQLEAAELEIQNLRSCGEDTSRLKDDLDEAWRRAEEAEKERNSNGYRLAEVETQLHGALTKESEFSHQLTCMQKEMRKEFDESIQRWTEERARGDQHIEALVSKLQSIWDLLQKCIGDDQVGNLVNDVSYGDGEETDRVGILALRATASVVADVDRNRDGVRDLSEKLENAEAEVERLTDRAEIAEKERDALRGTVERVERKASNAHTSGQEEARAHFHGIVSQLKEDLGDSRDEIAHVLDKATRSEKEAGELRALVNKITSQLNGRTNELDEAEEKLAYLQDQVTTLDEDLEEAHRRLKQAEEESAEVRQNDVERLTKDLQERSCQLERIEEECARLRSTSDEAEKKARESEVLAHTHQQAEENLQIAIEQLEAAQEGAIQERTIALEKKLREAEQGYEEATKREKVALVTESQLKLCDEEIRELRGAIGRLSDERVELKLELEKSLSRLNHPDSGGQLVDRRVVRQLLISYFRVGSVRRRDVLELMSRMLAFSDADNVAVGLKRRALMDRIGSLVQAPELDNGTLPPLGTVSDKWIEFLMKETEEGEEQARGW